MKSIQKYILLTILLIPSPWMYGQSSLLDSTLTFTSVQNIDLYTDQVLSDTFSISINATQLILETRDGSKQLTVQNVQGTWSVISQEGQLTFDVPVQNVMGKGKLQNVAGALYLIIDFSERKDWMKRKFTLNSLQP